MADSNNPFDAFTPAQPKEGQSPSFNQFKSGDAGGVDFFKTFGGPGGAKPEGKSEDDAYEAKVKSLMPKAHQYVQERGPVEGGPSGAFIEGVGKLGEWTGLRTGVRGAMAALGAGEGKNFSERYEQLKAEDEAVKRAFEEKHPIMSAAGELAGVAAAVPAGVVAAPVEAALTARKLSPALAGIAGMGAEGAAFGAGTAAAEQAFGTHSKQTEPGIVSSALVGGGLGAGLGAAGKGISAAYNAWAPDVIKNFVSGDKRQMQKISDWIGENKGDINLSDWAKAKEEGKPVTLYHLINPEKHDELAKILEGHPEAAKILQDRLATWSGDAQGSLRDFANSLLSTKATPAEMETTAKALAAQRVQQAYNAAKREGNGAGSWSDSWNKWLNTNTFTEALDKTIADMREKTALRTGDPDNYVSPFQKVEASELQADPSDARAMAESFFKKKGVEPPDAIEHLGDGTPAGRYQLVNRNGVDIDFLDTLQRNLNRAGNMKMNIENTPSGDLGAEIMKARGAIMDSLTNPKSQFYNKEYAEALSAHNNTQRTEDAFTYGRKIWQTDKNARKASQIAEDVAAMSPREKFYVAHGLMEEAIANVSRADGTVNIGALNNLLKEGPRRQAIETALGERRFGELERHIRTQAALSNAITSAEKLGRGSSFDYNTLRDIRNIGWYFLYDKAALVSFAYRWAEQNINGKFAKNLAEKLASDDIDAFRQGLSALESNEKNKASFGQYIMQNAPRALGLAAGHADGGEVKGYAFGGAPNERRIVNKSVAMPKPGDPDFVGPTMTASSYDPNKSHVFDKLNVFHGDNPHWTPDLGNASARGYAVNKSGRSIMRSTGGRIPEADKLFKQAKKYVDSHTKQLLNVHDDDIVKALRVAAKRV